MSKKTCDNCKHEKKAISSLPCSACFGTLGRDKYWEPKEERKADMFTKDDLKDGMIVVYRDGNNREVRGDDLINDNGQPVSSLKCFRDDLTCSYSKENDIVKVIQPETVLFERINKITVEEAVAKLQEAFGESFEIAVTK